MQCDLLMSVWLLDKYTSHFHYIWHLCQMSLLRLNSVFKVNIVLCTTHRPWWFEWWLTKRKQLHGWNMSSYLGRAVTLGAVGFELSQSVPLRYLSNSCCVPRAVSTAAWRTFTLCQNFLHVVIGRLVTVVLIKASSGVTGSRRAGQGAPGAAGDVDGWRQERDGSDAEKDLSRLCTYDTQNRSTVLTCDGDPTQSRGLWLGDPTRPESKIW